MFGSDRWHARVDKIPVLGRVLGGMGRLGDFYRDHPPKPLVYYIFYPLLLPVILFLRVPRREFFLYRKLNAIALVVIVAGGTWDYFRHWRPELTLHQFAGATLGMFILQLLSTFAFVMPIVTTLLGYQARGLKKTLLVLVLLATAMSGFALFIVHKQHAIQIGTWMRIDERTKEGFKELHECQAAGLDARTCVKNNAAIVALVRGMFDACAAKPDAALDAARARLEGFYKEDEAKAFRFFKGDGACVLFVRFGSKKPIWVAADAKGLFDDPRRLPPSALKEMLSR
jgi:hypothetical protein